MCVAAVLTLPVSARALTLPAASLCDAVAPGAAVGLKDGSQLWRLLNPSAPAADAESDEAAAPPLPGGAREDRDGGDVERGNETRDDLPPWRKDNPTREPHAPGQGLQPAGAGGGGSSRAPGGDGPTQAGLPAAPVDLAATSAGRLPADRPVLDLPEHGTFVFRPAAPDAAATKNNRRVREQEFPIRKRFQ